jgi:tetratricopeptide (TPR) repeat protein
MFASCSRRTGLALACFLSIASFALAAPAAAQEELNADARSNLQKGLELYRRESFAEARDAFRASVDAQRHSQAAFHLGLTYARLGDPERAARHLKRALRWEPPLGERDRKQAEAVIRWAESADPDEAWGPPREFRGDAGSPSSRRTPKTDLEGSPSADRDRDHPDLDAIRRRLEKVPVVELDAYPDSRPFPPADPKADLTGAWTSDDGSRYFVRQVGERVYWYGESPDDGASFANIFTGKRAGDRVTGEWIDVPRGSAMNVGWLEFEVLADGTLKKLTSSIPYGASTWKR